jgi:hypothetical protein
MTLKTSDKPGSYARRVYGGLIVAILFLTLVHLLLQHLNLNVHQELNGRVYELSNRVDFDDEVSVPTWFSQALFLAISGGSFLLSFMQKAPAARRLWAFLGVVALLLSIDEVGALHELLLQTIHLLLFGETGPTIVANAWLALLPIILAAAIITFWVMLKHVPMRTIRLFVMGGIVFLIGAIFVDIVTTADNVNTFYNKGILVGIEESLELLGVSTILYAIIDYIETTYRANITSALKKLKG